MLVPPRWQGGIAERTAALHAHVIDRFFPADALWYERIAGIGYTWNPADPRQQDVAFFPLWPAVLKTVAFFCPSASIARWLTIGLAAAIAGAAIAAFHRLALRLLPARPAATATWLFALYPAANFNLQSYPTGLMNLLTILVIHHLMDGRLYRAAMLSGIVTAAGPLGLGSALAVCSGAALRLAAQLRGKEGCTPVETPGQILRAAGAATLASVVSVSGLLAFLILQLVLFRDPLAFIKAQEAWAAQLPWLHRVPVALTQLLVLPDVLAAARNLKHVLHPPSLTWLYLALQKSLYMASEGLMIVAIAASSRLKSRPLFLQAAFTLALFIWFHSTSRPGNSTLRLMYCAIGIFPGCARLLADRPRLAACTIALSGLLLAGAAALTVGGYSVT